MRQLAGLLPGSRRVDVDDAGFCDDLSGDAILIDSLPPFLEKPDEPDVHLLHLATSVFTCLGSTISSIRAGPHLRSGALQTHWHRTLHFSMYLYLLLFSLSLGKGLLIEIQVLHCMEKESEPETHSHPSRSPLPNAAKADMVRREELDLYIKDKSWTCEHCSVHYLAPVIRKGAIDHCKAVYVSFFPPSSPVLLLLPCPCACISRLRFFFLGFMKSRNPSPNRKHRLPLRHRDGTNYAQTSCIELLMFALS